MNSELENICLRVSELYIKFGIKSITMDDISRELGISKKTLYQYIKDKEELVEKVLDYLLQYVSGEVTKIMDANLNAVEETMSINSHITKTIEKFHNPAINYDLRKYYPAIYRKFTEKKHAFAFASMTKNLKKGMNEGLYRANINISIITKLQLARIESQIDNDLFPVSEYSAQEIFKQIQEYHMRGICTAEGIRIFEEKLNQYYANENN